MEVVWMMAGSDNANWISEYNSRMASYAENNVLHGAYGARWERGLQIAKVIEKLKTDPNSRQAVISMWDCFLDNQPGKGDYPCNTHIYFRINRGELDMTVCNRSNDLIWGMLGSNVVHFTMLQELIAHEIGCPMGRYQVFTNNLHIYERHWELLDHRLELDDDMAATMNPLLAPDETIVEFITDAKEMLCEKRNKTYRTRWFNEVAVPVQAAYRSHKARQPLEDTKGHIESIKDFAVARACREWMAVKYENYYGVNTYVSK
jgi:thymidylate synthase